MVLLMTSWQLGQPLQAATLVWDIGPGDGAVITDGAGTWSDGTGNWNDGATDANWNNATPDDAVFGGGTLGAFGTVTLGSAITAGSLTFGTPFGGGAYTLDTDTFALTLNSGITANEDATIQSGAGGSIIFGADNTLDVAGAKTLAVNSIVDGAFALIKTGAGTLVLGATNTYSGATTISNGTLRFNANNATGGGAVVLSADAGATAIWDLNGFDASIGTLTIGGSTSDAASVNQISTGAGTLTLGGNLTVTSTGDWTTAAVITGKIDLGSANRTFVVNNSAGTEVDLYVDAVISGGFQLSKNNAGTMLLVHANTYTGNTVINGGVFRLSGLGSVLTSPQVTVASSDGTLEIGTHADTVFAMDRIGDSNQLELQDAGEAVFFGANDTVNTTTETLGILDSNTGHNVVTLNPISGGQIEIFTSNITSTGGGTFLIRGPGLGQAAAADTSRIFTTTPFAGADFIGGGGAAASTNISIIPWIVGNGNGVTGSGENFVTYDANGLRPLVVGEYATSISEGVTSDNNVLLSGATSVDYRAGVNALRMDTGSSLTLNNGRVFEITSGAFLDNSAAGVTIDGGTLEFGTQRAIFYLAGADPATAITTTISSGMRNTGANGGLILTASNNDSELILNGASGITGNIYINRGILRLDSDQALNPFSRNSIGFSAQGGTATARLRLNETDVYMGQLINSSNGFVSNGGTADATFGVNQTTNRDVNLVLQDTTTASTGKLNLLKSGGSRLSFLVDSTFTGTATVQAGTLELKNGADWDSVGGIIIEGGTFQIYNTSSSSSNTNRLPNGMTMTFRGGQFTFSNNNNSSTSYSEQVGTLALEAGVNTITNDGHTNTGRNSVIIFNLGNNAENSVTRVAGAVARFRAIDVSLGNTRQARIQIGQNNAATADNVALIKNGVLHEGGVAYAVVGDDFATINDKDIANAGSGYEHSVAAIGSDGATTGSYQTSTDAATWLATDNVNVAAGPITNLGTLTINTLILGDGVDLDLSGGTLTVDAGGILALSTTAAKFISNGSITGGAFAGNEIVLRTGNDANTGETVTLAANIVDNGGDATSFTKWGTPDLVLTGANTFTGSLNITQGSVIAGGMAQLGTATTGRILRMASGTTLDFSASTASEALPFDTIIASGIGQGTISGPSGQTTTFTGTIGGHGDLRFNNTFDVTLTGVTTFRDGLTFGGDDAVITTANDVSNVTLFAGDNEIGGALRIGLNQREAELTQASGTLKVGFAQYLPNLDIGVGDASGNLVAVGTRGLLDLSGTSNFEAQVNNIRVGVVTAGAATAEGDLIIGQDSNLHVGTAFFVGDSASPGQSGITSSVVFGSGTNTVRVPTLIVGGRKSTGEMTIAAGGTLNLNGVTGATVNVSIGDQRDVDTGAVATGLFDMTGGTLVARIESLEIGDKERSASNGGTGGAFGTLTTGTSASNDISAISILLGRIQRGTGTSNANSMGQGTINMQGGVFDVFGDITMGDWSDNSGSNGTAKGILNITGGTMTISGDIVKTDHDRSGAMILLNGGTLDLQHQAFGDTTAGSITASQFDFRSGSLVDAGTITLDGRGVTDGITFDNLDHALLLRDVTVAADVVLTNANDNKGGILYDATGAGAGATLSGSLNLGGNIHLITVQDSAGATHDLTLGGAISGTSGLVKTGAGTLLLSGTGSNYTGNTEIREGRLTLSGGANDRLPNGTTVILGDGGTSGVLQLGDSSGASDQTLPDLAISGTGTGNSVVGGNAAASTLDLAPSGAATFAGVIGGVGANENNLNLVMSGTGSFALNGAASHSGSTSVTGGGTLDFGGGLNGTTSLSTSGSGSVLRVSGGFAGASSVTSVNVGDGAVLNLLNGEGDKLNMLTSLTLGSSGGTMSFLNLNVGDDAASGDELRTDTLTLLTGGTLTLFGGNQITLSLTDTGLNPNETYDLISVVDGGLTAGVLGSGDWILGGTPGGCTSISLNVTDTLIQLQTGTLITGKSWWNAGGAADTWNDVANWAITAKDGLTPAISTPGQGTDVVFIADNINSGTNAPITTTLEQNFKVNSLTFEASTNAADTPSSVTIDPGSVITSRLEVAPQIATDGVVISTGGPGTVTINSRFRVGASQAWNVATGSSLTFTNTIVGAVGSTTLTLNGDGTSNGTIILRGVDGVASYTGPTILVDGRLILEGGAGNRLPVGTALTLGGGTTSGILQLGDGTNGASDTTIGDLLIAGTGTANAIVGGNAAVSTLTVMQSTNATFTGVIGGTNSNEDNLALTKAGGGELTLDAVNTYTGITIVNDGTLTLGSSGGITQSAGLTIIANAGVTATFDNNGRSTVFTGGITLGGADSSAQAVIANTTAGGSITLGGDLFYDAANDPLGASIAVALDLATTARTFTINDSATAATDLTISGDVSATNVALTLDGTGFTRITGNITLGTGASADLVKNGTGTLQLEGAFSNGDDIIVNEGTLNLNGVTTISDDIFVDTPAAATLNLNVADAIQGTGSTGNFLYVRDGGTVNVNVNDAIGSLMEGILLGDNNQGIGNLVMNANATVGRIDVGNDSSGEQGFVTGTGTLTVTTILNLDNGAISANLAGDGNIDKENNQSVILSGINNLTSASNTLIREGSLILDFTTNAGTDNKIGTGVLTLGTTTESDNRAILSLLGSSSTPSTQTVDSIVVVGGPSEINFTSAGGQALTFAVVNEITRTGGTLNLTLDANSTFDPGTTTNTNGIIGAWFILNDSDFGSVSGSNSVVAAAYTIKNDVSLWGSNENITNDAVFTGTVGADCNTINSLRFDAFGSSTVTIGTSLIITSGGILETAGVGANPTLITGGILISGINEFILTQSNDNGALTIDSMIYGGAAINKNGTGTVILSGINNQTGTISIAEGILQITGGSAISDTSAVNIRDNIINTGLELLDVGWRRRPGQDHPELRIDSHHPSVGGPDFWRDHQWLGRFHQIRLEPAHLVRQQLHDRGRGRQWWEHFHHRFAGGSASGDQLHAQRRGAPNPAGSERQ